MYVYYATHTYIHTHKRIRTYTYTYGYSVSASFLIASRRHRFASINIRILLHPVACVLPFEYTCMCVCIYIYIYIYIYRMQYSIYIICICIDTPRSTLACFCTRRLECCSSSKETHVYTHACMHAYVNLGIGLREALLLSIHDGQTCIQYKCACETTYPCHHIQNILIRDLLVEKATSI